MLKNKSKSKRYFKKEYLYINRKINIRIKLNLEINVNLNTLNSI